MSKPMPNSKGLSGKATTWLVVVIVAAVVAGMILYGQGKKKRVEVTLDENLFKSSAPALQPMDTDAVSEMSVTIAGQTIVAGLENGEWRLSEPINDQADNAAVKDVIGIFSEIASDEIVENPGAPAQYGLDKPFAEATFTVDGVEKNFVIGREGDTNIYYAKTSASEDLFVVRGLPEELVALRPVDLVNAQLLAFNADDVVKIDAYASSDDGQIKRTVEKKDGRWFDASGSGGIVFDVATLLRDLRYVNVADVMSTGGSGLNPGTTMHLELTLKDGSTKVLDVGDKLSDSRLFYVKSSDRPHTYAVAEFIAENLTTKLDLVGTDLMGLDRDRTVGLALATADAEGVTNERSFSLTDGALPWKLEGGAVAFQVGNVIDSIVEVNAMSFAPDSDATDYGFYPAPGSMQVTATLDNDATIQLDLGAVTADGSNRYVKSSAREGVFLTPVIKADNVASSISEVRTDMVVFDPAAVTEITYYASDWSGQSSKTLTKQGDKWSIEGETRDAAKVDKFLQTLKALTADNVAETLDEAEYGFYPASDAWRVELGFENGEKLAVDVGGKKTEGSGWFTITNYFVRVSDLTDVVLIGEFKVGDIKTPLDDIL